jgi:peptide deformylase
MVQKVVDVKNPILRKKAKPVEKIDTKVLKLIKDMKETLNTQKDPEGVGLAAPQIGKSLRIFIVDYKKLKRVIINPEIIELSEQKLKTKEKPKNKEILEGCLSLPHYYGPIRRAKKIKIKYLNEESKEQIEEFTGFNAQIIGHEIDHLNGILFVDKILEQNAPLYKFDGEEWEEVEIL